MGLSGRVESLDTTKEQLSTIGSTLHKVALSDYIFKKAHSVAPAWYVNSSQQEKNKMIPAGRILQIVLVADNLDNGEGARGHTPNVFLSYYYQDLGNSTFAIELNEDSMKSGTGK